MDLTFRYAPDARSWRLDRVDELSYHTSFPDGMVERRYRYPPHFGRIEVEDFDPQRWKGSR